MKASKLFFCGILFSLGLLATSCHPVDYYVAPSTPSNSYNNNQNTYTPTVYTVQNYDYKNYDGFYGYLNEGTYLSIPPNAFIDVNGYIVHGRIALSVVEILKKSEMFLDSVSTVSDSAILESGGILKISATQYGNPLALNSGVHISASFLATGSPLKMKFYNGISSKFGYTDWISNKDSINNSVSLTKDSSRSGSTYIYNLTSSGTGWISAEHLAGLSPLTTVNVHLTNSGTFTNETCAFIFPFISVAIMNKDTGTNNFIIAEMPVGIKATLVIRAKKGNVTYSAFVPVTITANMKNQVTLTQMSDNEFYVKLRALD